MARKHSNFNERDFERALKSVKGEPDFTKKEFCEELLKHFSPDKTGKEFFSEVYVRLLDRDKKFNLKGNYGIETKTYLGGCSEYIHISTQHDGQLLIHTEKPYSYRDNRQDRGSSTPEKTDDFREGLFARWVVRPIADIVGKRLRELIAENSEKKEEIDRLNSRVSSLESENTELEKDRDLWKNRWKQSAKRNRETREEIRDSQIDVIENERAKEKAEKEELEKIVKEHGWDRLEGEEDTSPKTVLQAVEIAKEEFGFLLFFDSAFQSAKNNHFEYPDRVLEALRKLDLVASEWLFQEDGDGITFERAFRESNEGPNFAIAEKESQTSQQKHDRIFRTGAGFKSTERQMLAHVKLGTKGGAGRTLRIHYYADRRNDKVEIGYCGEHL